MCSREEMHRIIFKIIVDFYSDIGHPLELIEIGLESSVKSPKSELKKQKS
jgi:hypothetical protein